MSAFLQELLQGEEAWTAPRLLEALKRRFFVTFHPGTVRRKLLEMGYLWKRTRYVPTGKPREEEVEGFKAALGEVGAGERGGPPGEAPPGGLGPGVRAFGRRCGTGKVVACLEGLSRKAAEGWRERGLEVAYLPRYSPHLNPVERVWQRVKGFLMPRRRYGSVEELREAVAEALEMLPHRGECFRNKLEIALSTAMYEDRAYTYNNNGCAVELAAFFCLAFSMRLRAIW